MAMETTAIGTELARYLDRLRDKGLQLGENAWLAGGAIRRAVCGHPIAEGDFDIYIKKGAGLDTAGAFGAANQCFASTKRDKDGRTTRDYTIDGLKLQFHEGYGDSMSAVLKSFDFTCCQFACDGRKVYYIGDALADARNLKLVYTGTAGYWTIARVFRLQEMGFKPTRFTLTEMQKLAQTYVGGSGKGRS